jgi:CRP-like cAMP-binding protein
VREGAVGSVFKDGETIVRQGEIGNCMYVIQQGRVEVVREQATGPVRLAILETGDFFGEMAIFDHESRSATVRSLGESRVLTVDRRTFFRRIQDDPSLAFRIVKGMSRRIRDLDEKLAKSSSA